MAGCSCCTEPKKEGTKETPALTDKATPEWSYDQPFYIRPADGVDPIKEFNSKVPEYYTSKRLLQIPRPDVSDTRKAPRTAIWVTKDNGMSWKRIGYFGLQQVYYPYEVMTDGTYGIRFIGPGIPPADCKPPKPHMIFYVDTVPPEVTVFISPDQECYYPGQMVHIEWKIADQNLSDEPIQVSVCMDSKAKDLCWAPLNQSYYAEGQADMVVPDDAIDKTLLIRVDVYDRAKNLGQGYSCPINVAFQSTTQPTTSTAPSTQGVTTMPQAYPTLEK
jgi:hypothetical protein